MLAPLVGVGAAAVTMTPRRWRFWMLTIAILIVSLSHRGNLGDKLYLRVQTYQVTLQATWEHPWVGVGLSPLAAPVMLHQRQAPLEAIHSSWLSLAFHHGWMAVVLLLGCIRRWFTRCSRLGRGVIVALSVWALFDDVFRWPGVVALMLFVLLLKREARHA